MLVRLTSSHDLLQFYHEPRLGFKSQLLNMFDKKIKSINHTSSDFQIDIDCNLTEYYYLLDIGLLEQFTVIRII